MKLTSETPALGGAGGKDPARAPYLPLGSRGVIDGFERTVVAYMQRTDETGVFSWYEYLLESGIARRSWLLEQDGHWTFFQDCDLPVYVSQAGARLNDEMFAKFESSGARIKAFSGEFFWNINQGQESHITDFIAPPAMLTKEKRSGETFWHLGRYMQPAEIRKAFSIADLPPGRVGVGMCQPMWYSEGWSKIVLWGAVFFMTLMMLQYMTTFQADDKLLFRREYVYTRGKNEPIVSDAFTTSGIPRNVRITLSGYVENAWLDTQVSLINQLSQEERSGLLEVAYYSGRDAEGTWSEGTTQHDIIIGNLNPGTYRLLVEPFAHGNVDAQRFRIEIRQRVAVWSNWVFGCLFLLTLLTLLWFQKQNQEQSRWSTSDFSPFNKEDE